MIKTLVRSPSKVSKGYETDVEMAYRDGNASGLVKFGLLEKLFLFVYAQCTDYETPYTV